MDDPDINGEEQFEMVPNNTFFGIGKSKGHCFTIPKRTHPWIMKGQGLSLETKEVIVALKIDNLHYPARIRLIDQNRSKTQKYLPEELPKRIVLNFNWKPYEETKDAIREYFEDSFKALSSGQKNSIEGARFTHIGGGAFRLEKFDLS